MRKLSILVLAVLAALILVGVWPGLLPRPALAQPQPAVSAPPVVPVQATPFPTLVPLSPFRADELYVHLPPHPSGPLTVLVALHGMGGNGPGFASNLVAEADKNGWLLIAPTMGYADYLNIPLLVSDDVRFSRMLLATLDVLPARLGIEIAPKVMLYGFSRGAQLAHRFAMFYPERVSKVAIFAAGSYTMPFETRTSEGKKYSLPLPYGVSDLPQKCGRQPDLARLKEVQFWLGVGAKDNHSGDVARSFDQYEGSTRVDRALAFDEELDALGIQAQLTVFAGAGHEVTPEMRNAALAFLSAQ